MVVLAVFGILTVMGYWGAQSLLPGYRLNGAASMVRGDLHRARALAVKKHREYRAAFSAGNKITASNDYELQQGNQRTGSTSWTLKVGRSFSDYGGVSVKSVTGDPVFSPRGTASGDVTIRLQNEKGAEKQIQVFLAGRIKTSDV